LCKIKAGKKAFSRKRDYHLLNAKTAPFQIMKSYIQLSAFRIQPFALSLYILYLRNEQNFVIWCNFNTKCKQQHFKNIIT
jgi:hypothetical protein